MLNAILDYTLRPRTDWMQRWAAQCVLNGSQVLKSSLILCISLLVFVALFFYLPLQLGTTHLLYGNISYTNMYVHTFLITGTLDS